MGLLDVNYSGLHNNVLTRDPQMAPGKNMQIKYDMRN